ncbi:MAG TPA: class I SAM-dependent methyltransferase [Cytophagaceae bacterium]|jgi:SAM-dependent methyltransferase
MENNLINQFGNIDIYLFDQLLKGRFGHCKNILDVGCGSGRNLVYFLRNGFNVYGVDLDPWAVGEVQALNNVVAPGNPPENFKVAPAESLPYKNGSFDLIICSAVLHFARNQDHFDAMLQDIWRVLIPGGYLFIRLASNIGIEHLVEPLGEGRYHLPDGSERFLVTEEMLLYYTQELGGRLFENIKTTNVQNLRCMTTWCLQKM